MSAQSGQWSITCQGIEMDIRFFLEQRLSFIKQLYINGAAPFIERKRKIDAEEAPFIPPYSEDVEPAFLTEWLEADSSIEVLGGACLSMVSASLHLYLTEWHRRLGTPPGPSLNQIFKKQGWPNGYKAFYAAHGAAPFEEGPFDFDLIEELVLARNNTQHPDSLVFDTPRYSDDALAKMPSPFFVSDRERALIEENDGETRQWLCRPSINVTSEKFLHAIDQVSAFVAWLEKQGEQILHKRWEEKKRQRKEAAEKSEAAE